MTKDSVINESDLSIPNDLEPGFKRAMLLVANGETTDARKIITALLETDPDLTPLRDIPEFDEMMAEAEKRYIEAEEY